MNNPNGKSEPKLVNIKKGPYEAKTNFSYSNIISILVIVFCLTIGISIIKLISITQYYEGQILEKDKKIEKIKKKIYNLDSELKDEKSKKLTKNEGKFNEKILGLEREYLYDKNFFLENNLATKENLNKLGYLLITHQHSLEKDFSSFSLRPFGTDKINIIIDLLKRETNYENHEKDFSFIIGINTLREYKNIYEKNKWTYKDEYKEVLEFLKNYTHITEKQTGAYTITKEELKKSYNVDYKSFIKSRHSTRNYKHEDLILKDIEEAVEMAKYSPSAYNRQFIKLHYYPKGKMKENVIQYSLGKRSLYLEGVNTFIITFDVNGLWGYGERNQGYFNAGLFAANLVNAFHSLGIGTCYIGFSNPVDQEERLKKLNDIPSNERIAVILFAGYYDEKSIFAVSPRKDVDDYLIEHN